MKGGIVGFARLKLGLRAVMPNDLQALRNAQRSIDIVSALGQKTSVQAKNANQRQTQLTLFHNLSLLARQSGTAVLNWNVETASGMPQKVSDFGLQMTIF
jgi:hypothetical protein